MVLLQEESHDKTDKGTLISLTADLIADC